MKKLTSWPLAGLLGLLGAVGAARTWRARGWVGGNGPLVNVNQRVEFLELLDMGVGSVRWLRLQSGADVKGLRVAHQLALEGMCKDLLWEVIRPYMPVWRRQSLW